MKTFKLDDSLGAAFWRLFATWVATVLLHASAMGVAVWLTILLCGWLHHA